MKKMTLVLVAVILGSVTFVSGSCNLNYNPGSSNEGEYVTQERTIGSFNRLEISGAFEVYIKQGSKESLTVEAESIIIDKIITEVIGNTLKIYTERDCCRNAQKMAIYLTIVDLSFVDISGACEMENEGTLKLDKLGIDVSGASEIDLTMNLSKLELDLSGASEITFIGSCSAVYLDASGASEIDGVDFQVGSMTIDASGASDCRINVTDELHIEASGASTVRYAGNPKIISNASGASSIKPL